MNEGTNRWESFEKPLFFVLVQQDDEYRHGSFDKSFSCDRLDFFLHHSKHLLLALLISSFSHI